MKKAAKRILFVTLLIPVTFLLTEAALWLLAPIPAHPPFTHVYKQNIPGVQNSVVYSLNEYGLRSSSINTREKGSRTIRIFAMGASTTQLVTQSFDDTWYGIIEKKLQDEFSDRDIKIEVAAWGQGGYKVWHGYQFCKDELSNFEPDIVITLWGANNLAFDGGPDYAYPGRSQRLSEINRWQSLNGIKRICRDYSQVYRRLNLLGQRFRVQRGVRAGQIVENWQNKLPQIRSNYNKHPYTDHVLRDPDPIVEFEDAMEELLQCLRSQGTDTIVLGQATLWKENMSDQERQALWLPINSKAGKVRPTGRWLEKEIQAYNEVQRRAAAKFGATFMNLDALIPKNLQHYFDDCHFTDQGNRAAAAALYPALRDRIRKVMETRKPK